jgi:hypothetical protein
MTTHLARDDVRSPFQWPVTIENKIMGGRAEDLYRVYLDSFAALGAKAASRQILSADEFYDELGDSRIVKYTVWRSDNDPVALATVTNQLSAVPWISPEFYASRHPAQAERNAIYYLGIALVAPGRGQFRILERLVQELVKPCLADKGVLAFDVCAFNDLTIRFGQRAETVLHRIAPVRVSVADTQIYYQAVFD